MHIKSAIITHLDKCHRKLKPWRCLNKPIWISRFVYWDTFIHKNERVMFKSPLPPMAPPPWKKIIFVIFFLFSKKKIQTLQKFKAHQGQNNIPGKYFFCQFINYFLGINWDINIYYSYTCNKTIVKFVKIHIWPKKILPMRSMKQKMTRICSIVDFFGQM